MGASEIIDDQPGGSTSLVVIKLQGSSTKLFRGIKIFGPGHRKEPQTFIRAATVDQSKNR
jgi:hypothetical protein